MPPSNYPIAKNTSDRLELADNILKLLRTKYKDDLLAVAIYGSVARGEDSAYSDIEFIAVVNGSNIDESFDHIYQGLKFNVDVVSRDVVLEDLEKVDLDWAKRIGIYLNIKSIYDPQNIFREFREKFSDIRITFFKPFIREIFIEDIYEQLYKYFGALDSGKEDTIRYLTFHLFDKMVGFIGAINKSYFGSATTRAQDAMNMPVNFPSFVEFGKLLLGGHLSNITNLDTFSHKLLQEILEYLEDEGIVFEEQELVI